MEAAGWWQMFSTKVSWYDDETYEQIFESNANGPHCT